MLRRCSISVIFSVVFASALASACSDVVDEEVPPEVCVSGKRWIGGDRGSPMMYPGRDCVGCHKDNDAPELVIGGTFYATQDDDDSPQGEDCFGLEGVRITINSGDGQVYETVTNAAGNFWFAARDLDLVMPYSVVSRFRDPITGLAAEVGMGTTPAYGGCARCHRSDALTIAESGAEFERQPADAEYVNGQGQMGPLTGGGVAAYLQFLADGNTPANAFIELDELER